MDPFKGSPGSSGARLREVLSITIDSPSVKPLYTAFNLLDIIHLIAPPVSSRHHATDEMGKLKWFEYMITTIGDCVFRVNVGFFTEKPYCRNVAGYRNTGNVRIWPSEQVLSYYICANRAIFRGKHVLELGGGMTCLAGLFIAKYTDAKSVLLTDGNPISVNNVNTILQCNNLYSSVSCAVIDWTNPRYIHQYEIIVCADCVFFDDTRQALVNCIYDHLLPGGLAIIMAPRRGRTLDDFISKSMGRGLNCTKIVNYNGFVFQKRQQAMQKDGYNDSNFYPILVEVRKLII